MSHKIILILLLLFSSSVEAFWHSFFPEQTIIQPPKPTRKATIMLAPLGSSGNQGRSLKRNFEFTIAHNFVHALKEEITAINPQVHVIISHERTEDLQPMQLANAANCLAVDLFLHVQFCYLEKESKPHLYLYHCSCRNDFFTKPWSLSWCHANEAYLINKKLTTSWAQMMMNILTSSDNAQWFTAMGPYAAPLKSMIGIIPPALLIEIGLKDDDEWKQFITPTAESLQPIISEIINTVKQAAV